MILKVGDRIKGVYDNTQFTGTVFEITGYNNGTIERDDKISGSGCKVSYGNGWLFDNLQEYKLELISNNKNINMKEKFVQMFLKEPENSFRKAGITNGDGLITSDGSTLFLTWLLSKNGDAFKTDVVDGLLVEDKESK